MAEKLLEIKGIGIKTMSGFLAEVGDINRFDNPKELQKLAGLALVENRSGKHKGKTTISKRGRKRLRYLLFEVAVSLVAKNPEFRELHSIIQPESKIYERRCSRLWLWQENYSVSFMLCSPKV